MKLRLVASMLCVALVMGFAPVRGEDEAAAEKTVYVLSGPGAAKASVDDLVRIEAKGIAGSSITAKVTGPAKVQKVHVIRLVDGKPSIGGYDAEFLVTPTGKGKVTVAVTVTYPTGGDPKKENYTITFE